MKREYLQRSWRRLAAAPALCLKGDQEPQGKGRHGHRDLNIDGRSLEKPRQWKRERSGSARGEVYLPNGHAACMRVRKAEFSPQEWTLETLCRPTRHAPAHVVKAQQAAGDAKPSQVREEKSPKQVPPASNKCENPSNWRWRLVLAHTV